MKIEGMDWMEWLHKMRAKEEEKRQREGISLAEWLRRVNEEADVAMADVREHEQPPVARDAPRPKRGK